MDKFCAELVVRSEAQRGSRLEIEFSDGTGQHQTISISPDAVAALAEIVGPVFDIEPAIGRTPDKNPEALRSWRREA